MCYVVYRLVCCRVTAVCRSLCRASFERVVYSKQKSAGIFISSTLHKRVGNFGVLLAAPIDTLIVQQWLLCVARTHQTRGRSSAATNWRNLLRRTKIFLRRACRPDLFGTSHFVCSVLSLSDPQSIERNPLSSLSLRSLFPPDCCQSEIGILPMSAISCAAAKNISVLWLYNNRITLCQPCNNSHRTQTTQEHATQGFARRPHVIPQPITRLKQATQHSSMCV